MSALEIISLIETLKKLFQRTAEINKEYFENFIEPIWISYVKIHENYKTSFNKYAEIALSKDFDAQSLIDRMKRESIYSEDMRAELQALVNTMLYVTQTNYSELYDHVWKYQRGESLQNHDKRGKLLAFLFFIIYYFNTQSTLQTNDGSNDGNNQYVELRCVARLANRPRYTAIIHLSRKNNEIEVNQILELLDDLILNLQNKFEILVALYYSLRRDYLS